MFGVRPVGHSVQYGVPSKSRSPFWKIVVLAARHPVSAASTCRPGVARMGGAGEVAERVTDLGRVAVRRAGVLVRAVALRCTPGRCRSGRSGWGDRVAERGAGLPVAGLELGADVDLVRAPRVDVAGLGRVELRLEVERRARAVGHRGGLEAVGGRGLHEAGLVRREVVHGHFEGLTTSRRGRVGHVEADLVARVHEQRLVVVHERVGGRRPAATAARSALRSAG